MARAKKASLPIKPVAEEIVTAVTGELAPEVEQDILQTIINVDKALIEEFPQPRYFMATGFRLFHPFQGKYLSNNEQTELVMDSWLECQINAGLVREV